MQPGQRSHRPSLATIAAQWGRIGAIGFGGPPTHIALLRQLCVRERHWLTSEDFEHALAAANLLPGPASTQLSIYCAWRLRGRIGGLVGGLCFILPGLIALIALSALFLAGSPPRALRGAAAGAGAIVAAVAVRAGLDVGLPLWQRAAGAARPRMLGYALVAAVGAALTGPYLVLVLLACGAAEVALRGLAHDGARPSAWVLPLAAAPAGLGALAWTSLKIGALAFGGGFVIVPLMQADAVSTYHWMTHAQFLGAVALGQITPGPLVQTIAAVGYAADGLPGALLAAGVAFAPSFAFVLGGAGRFARLRSNERVAAFLGGAAPAAAGAIIGSAIPLADALGEAWQAVLLAAAAVLLLGLRASIVPTLLAGAGVGLVVAALGGPVPI